ncbi:hypothetical protein PAHAL_5G332400 [Panicum hallii]|uniref:Uncharacterized protein n=1 Tax=Panicum hallii TaxID=206008 RepID=A0A2T8IM14_9POAL|nr:hypothetical protein PAHAL_5G332400 [Panicum hallii]
MASSRSCLPVPVAITKSYAECHSWFLELIEAMAQIFKLLWQLSSQQVKCAGLRTLTVISLRQRNWAFA